MKEEEEEDEGKDGTHASDQTGANMAPAPQALHLQPASMSCSRVLRTALAATPLPTTTASSREEEEAEEEDNDDDDDDEKEEARPRARPPSGQARHVGDAG
ncbi:unnamed protein product, partial [Prorocentrum cordatum]